MATAISIEVLPARLGDCLFVECLREGGRPWRLLVDVDHRTRGRCSRLGSGGCRRTTAASTSRVVHSNQRWWSLAGGWRYRRVRASAR